MFKRLLKRRTKGTTVIEYALIASLIAMIAISGMRFIGNSVNDRFNLIANGLKNGLY